jgi:histidinol phosphatase-like enzyme
VQQELATRVLPMVEFFVCPHHPEVGRCLCRKPLGLLFERALARLQADPNQSWMVGDQLRDVRPAAALGLRTILVSAVMNIEAPDLTVSDSEAAFSIWRGARAERH